MRVFLVLIFLCVSKILFAQWDIRPVGGDWFAYDTVLYRVPLGTSVNAGVTMYVYQTVGGQSYSLSLTSRMDSIRGAGFNPQQSGNVTSTISTYYPITENIIYRAGYEDTSIVHFIATSSFYDRDLYIMGIATISAASSFSLSKTDFGVLSTGDTSQTVLRLFNQTGDSERIVFSFTNGRDLTLLDPVVMPMTLAPGDSAAPLRISYRANGIRRVYNDSLFIQVQRLRNGTNYGSELDSFVALQGRCYPIYFRLSDTAFPRIRAGDSLVGSLMIYNPTSDTEQTWVYFSPSGDFYSSSTVDTQVVINPFDSSSSMPIWMHAIVGRKSVIDTLFLHLKWKGSDVDKLPILFSSVLSGGCSDLRFRVDSLFHHVFAFVGQQVSDSALIFNLTSDSLKLYMGCASNNEWISSIGSAGTSQSFGPFDSASVHFTFRPSTSGSDHDAYLKYYRRI